MCFVSLLLQICISDVYIDLFSLEKETKIINFRKPTLIFRNQALQQRIEWINACRMPNLGRIRYLK